MKTQPEKQPFSLVKRRFRNAMRIKETEARTGLTRKAIRYYEENGLITPVRSENGYKDYTGENLIQLLEIKKLRLLGFTVAEISMWQNPHLRRSLLEKKIHEKQAESQQLYYCRELLRQLAHGKDLNQLQIEEYLLDPVLAGSKKTLYLNFIFGCLSLAVFLCVHIFYACYLSQNGRTFHIPLPFYFPLVIIGFSYGYWVSKKRTAEYAAGRFLSPIPLWERFLQLFLTTLGYIAGGCLVFQFGWNTVQRSLVLFKAIEQFYSHPLLSNITDAAFICITAVYTLFLLFLELLLILFSFLDARKDAGEFFRQSFL